MPLGVDQQYDLSWEEQDKIRRRLELKKKLKIEGVNRRYNPFRMIDKIVFSDPANDKFMDIRKKGRLPGAPYGPKKFFSMVALLVVPWYLLYKIIDYERRPWLERLKNGEVPITEIITRAKH